MTAPQLRRIVDEHRVEPDAEMPVDAVAVAPPTVEIAAEILAAAAASATPVLFWGGGTHQGLGYRVGAPLVLSTVRLDAVVDWQPDDLTIVVRAGVTLAALDALLAERRQSAVLPEYAGSSTVGGVVAAGVSGYRRLRYGPTRDRVLESRVVTGDGRITTAGGRVVKNVTGYDIPRLVTGSLGSLGLIAEVCLKLWPVPTVQAALPVDDAAAALRIAYRPLAVLETDHGSWVFVAGTEEEVAGQAADLATVADPETAWPELPESEWQAQCRVPPAATREAVQRLRGLADIAYVAAHGVGTIDLALDASSASILGELRDWAESVGGSLVVTRRPEDERFFDPWGSPPRSIDLQRRVKAAFDPAGIANPGRLPGRI